MTAKDIFGFSHDDLAEAAAAVERALGIRLKLHESHYQGDYFEGETASGQRLVLQRNLDPMHDAKSDPPEERFFEHQ